MKKFNLSKKASSDYTISDKTLDENRKNMNLSNKQQGVVGKNINLSLPIKDKDNTIPFNKQLDAERKNETSVAITEAGMDKKEVSFGDKTEGVMPINVKTEEYNQEHLKDFKKAQDSSKRDTEFWDKYVGVQLEGEGQPTKVDNNIPASSSQLQNNPERFSKGADDKIKDEGLNLKVDKMVMASIKDADAMMFHIHAIAAKANRNLNNDEKQQIVDINAGKARLMLQARGIVNYSPGVKIMTGKNGEGIVSENGQVIDTLPSVAEAKANYPEAEIGKSAMIPQNRGV